MTRPTAPRAGTWRVAGLAAAFVLAGCASTSRVGSPPTHPAPSSAPAVPSTTTTDPGSLPQTTAIPSSDTPQFRAEMAALWQGVVDDSVPEAMAAFFPESAYLQVKTVADPAADFTGRLVAEFGADLGAAHALVASPGSQASLIEVVVPGQYAHWVPPGTCANRVGYYEVADSRLVYRQGADLRSFGIASLISWRGVWYVVHLGAILRSGPRGVVDDPETGTGSSAPSRSC